jgi:radical SAM superfamily enzyme YgiQ (UPF0313 family)
MPLDVGLLNLPGLTARHSLSYYEGVPPLGPAYMAAVAREAGHRPAVFDALGEGVDRHSVFPTSMGDLLVQGFGVDEIVGRLPAAIDVLGISFLFLHELRFLQRLVPRIRARFPDLVIVLGGETATGMWEDGLRLFPDVTAIVLGEGESAFPQLLTALERGAGLETVPSLAYRADGEGRATARAARIRDLDAIPQPAWDLFPVARYLGAGMRSGVNRGPSLPILTSRGCPFTCAFCSAPEMWGTAYYSRSPRHLLDEIEHLMRTYGATNFDFRDLSAAISKKWIRAFRDEVVTRGARFTWQIPQGMRSESLDRDSLRLLHESGCRNFGYALESVSPTVISRMQKKVVPERMFGSIREALRLDFSLEVFFIIGYPGETRADHWAYLRAIVRLAAMGVQSLSVMQFNPYPGSRDYRQFHAEGKIGFDDDSYVYSSLFRGSGQNPDTHSAFSSRYLVTFGLFSLVLFWLLQFLIRPWRFFRMLWNLARAREETILEQFLVVKTNQWRRQRRAPAEGMRA